MIHLRTLGTPCLETNAGSGPRSLAVQPKRLALLAYLALAGTRRYRRRDSTVALFWPELGDEHARGALRQALSYLRRSLGRHAILTRGEEEIAIDPDVLRCDAVGFEEAVAAGRYEAAVAMYGGDFLDGLFVSDASPELEHWVEDERSKLRQRAAQACSSLAEERRAGGDGTAAAAWARRAAALAPFDERELRRLIHLLDAVGDRAGAVEAYDQFARRLGTEYATEPSAETQAAIGAVRRRIEIADTATSPTRAQPLTAAGLPSTAAQSGLWRADEVSPVPARRWPRALSGQSAAVLAVVAGVLVVAGYLWFTAASPRHFAGNEAMRLAVLPIHDLSGDAAHPYIADGLTEQLITDLAQVRGFTLINHRSMLAYRASPKDPGTLAGELGVDAVLSGSLQVLGDSVRLSMRLQRAGEDRISWARSYQGAPGDLLRLARQAADAVAHDVRGGAPADADAALMLPRSVDPVALDLYIRGRYWWNKRGPGLLRSIQLFTAALDVEPTFALPYAGMADAYVQLGYASLLRPDDAFPKARAAAMRALELDSSLAEPHATLGFVNLYYEWDWPEAEQEFRRALIVNPSCATAHEWYGLFLAAMGRFDEAVAHERQAQQLDPLSTAIAGTAAWVLYYAGRNDEAARELRIALRADSSFALGHFYLGRVHQARGKLDSALFEYRATGPLQDWVPTIAAVGSVQGMQGRRQEALGALARLDSISHGAYVTAYAVALVHAALGQSDSAFAWLERGEGERTHWMVWLRRDPRWAPLRSDDRFEVLARRLRLPL